MDNEEKKVEKKVDKEEAAVHKTRDIYLAGYCALNGCTLQIMRSVGTGNERVMFVITATGAVVLKDLIQKYFKSEAQCDPKALKYKITDLKNQLYSVVDNR